MWYIPQIAFLVKNMGKCFKIHCLFQISFISSFPKLLNFSLYWHLQAALVQDLQPAGNDQCFCTAHHSTSPGFSTCKPLLPWSLDGHGHCALPAQPQATSWGKRWSWAWSFCWFVVQAAHFSSLMYSKKDQRVSPRRTWQGTAKIDQTKSEWSSTTKYLHYSALVWMWHNRDRKSVV